jgi:DNA-binding NarL/FixJ family response regulator
VPHRAASHGLSPRELEVLRLIAAGKSNREIAEDLSRGPRTVERHNANLYLKLDAHSRADAIACAVRELLA